MIYYRCFLNLHYIAQSESFKLKFPSNCKEGSQIFLTNSCLTKVEEVKDGCQVLGFETSPVDEWVGMSVSLEDFLKERT